jgi:putative salt-induced outer membrane protein YdiY
MRILVALVATCAPLLCADQVILKNGDVVTGKIVKKDGGKLTIHSEFMGDVTMPWDAVQGLKSDETITVVLPDGVAVAGKVTTANGRLEVAEKSAPLAEVAAMRNPAEQRSWERLQNPGLLQLWTGTFDLGFAFARGNARTDTLTTAMNAARITPKDKITLSFRQIYGTARIEGETGTIANAIRGGWQYNRVVTPGFFVGTFNDYEVDRFQNLDLRFVLGGSFGANLLKRERANLSVLGGMGYSRENFIDGLHRNSLEAHFGDDFVYRISSATSVTQAFRMFPNLTNTGAYRVNFDLGGVTAIRRWLGWQVNASDRYLSNPVFGRQRNDLVLSTGFRLSLGK